MGLAKKEQPTPLFFASAPLQSRIPVPVRNFTGTSLPAPNLAGCMCCTYPGRVHDMSRMLSDKASCRPGSMISFSSSLNGI